MPCLSSSAVRALKDSIRLSKAASQLALPRMITTFFDSSENCSPKGSAVCTGAGGGAAGVWAVEGVSAGDLVSAGGGTGAGAGAVAGGGAADGAGAGGAVGAGDCAHAAPPSVTAASAIMAK